MQTYILTRLVLQSGQTSEDARAVLEMNLGEVLPAEHFEVVPIAAEVPDETVLRMMEDD